MGTPALAALRPHAAAIAAGWLARVVGSYPERTARFLAGEPDRFRNPVGHALRETLPALVEELLGEMDPGRLGALLDEVVRVRAVQDGTPAEAVGFVFLLRDVVRGIVGREEPIAGAVEARVDRMALAAFEAWARARERMWRSRAGEVARRTALLDRMRARDVGRAGAAVRAPAGGHEA